MILLKKGVIFQPLVIENKFLSSSRLPMFLLPQLQSKHTKASFKKTIIGERDMRQGFEYLPRSSNFLSTCLANQSVAYYSKLVTQTDRNSSFLLGGSKLKENNAKFHTDEERTYVTLLNREENAPLMVDSFSQQGFRLNNGLAVVGAIALFPKSLLSWNVGSAEGVTRESLSLFYMIAPKIDLLVLGIGDPGTKFDISLLPFMRNHGISLEVLPTEKAVATYNFLTEEGRSVAGAFIPPSNLKPTAEDQADAIAKKRQLFEATVQEEFL